MYSVHAMHMLQISSYVLITWQWLLTRTECDYSGGISAGGDLNENCSVCEGYSKYSICGFISPVDPQFI